MSVYQTLAPATLAALAASSACESPPLPIEYETQHLRIGSEQGFPLCQGNLDAHERTIATIEDDLGIDLERTVNVYIWDYDSRNEQTLTIATAPLPH